MPLRVLGSRILVERSAAEEKKGHLILTTTEVKNQGTVVGVGDEVDNIHIGDLVVFDKYSGQEIDVDEKMLMILRYDQVLGVLS